MRNHLTGWALVTFALISTGCQAREPFPRNLQARQEIRPVSAESRSRAQDAEYSLASVDLLGNPGGQQAVRIVAIVNDVPILDEDVRAAGYQALLQANSREAQQKVLRKTLEQLIDREVVLQDAFIRLRRNGTDQFINQLKAAAHKAFNDQVVKRMLQRNKMSSEEELRQYLARHGMVLPLIRRHWERNFMMRQYLINRIGPHLQSVGHAEIQQYYDSHAAEFRVEDRVEWQDIFLAHANHGGNPEATRRFATVLIQRIRNGESFESLATQDFNAGDSALRKGKGIGHKRGEISPPEVEKVVFSLKEGEVGPPIELPTGFHLVRVVKRQYAGVRPFDEKVQVEIRAKLRQQIYERELKYLVEELKAQTIIEIVDEQ
jgi:peptidyl-prolyl cis-trans isomerase SurA